MCQDQPEYLAHRVLHGLLMLSVVCIKPVLKCSTYTQAACLAGIGSTHAAVLPAALQRAAASQQPGPSRHAKLSHHDRY